MRRLLPALLLAAMACGSANTPFNATPRPLAGLPASLTPPAGANDDTACRSPLTDPADGSRLTLERSWRRDGASVGDYRTEPGKYGLRDGEFLRVDCRTWQPLGAVPR